MDMATTQNGYVVEDGASLVKIDTNGRLEWTQAYPETEVRAWSVVQTGDGFALAGTDQNRIPLLIKTDEAGNMQWWMTYHETGTDDYCNMISLAYTADEGYAIAATVTPYYEAWSASLLLKIDSSGNLQWFKLYGVASDNNSAVTSIIQTRDGGFALAGATNINSSGGLDFWLLKTDAAGNLQWNKTYGGPEDEEAKSLFQTADGGYILAGYTTTYIWLVKTDSNGSLEWNQTFGGPDFNTCSSVIQTSDGGYALAGTQSSLFGVSRALLIKTDSRGSLEWNQTYDHATAFAISQATDGGYALAGSMSGNIWLIKTDAAGLIPEFPSSVILFALLSGTLIAGLARAVRAANTDRERLHLNPTPSQ